MANPSPIESHRYRDDIEALLVAGWSPRNINDHLGRIYPDYSPVHEKALQRWRHEHLKGVRLPLEKYEEQLRDEHVFLDTMRGRSAVIAIQKARLQRFLDAEVDMSASAEARGDAALATGFEITRLARLFDSYDKAAVAYGLGRSVQRQHAMSVEEYIQAEMASLPVEVRVRLADMLRELREERMKAELAEVDEERRRMLPPPESADGEAQGK